MSQQLIREIEQSYMKDTLPDVFPGDTVKVAVRIKEGSKERIQSFEGTVLRLANSGVSRTITVRRVFQGIGVERIFLIHSPKVDSIKVLRRGSVRRAKLYYMRGRSGKAARIREKLNAILPADNKSKKASKKASKAEPQAEQPKPEIKAEAAAPVAEAKTDSNDAKE